MVLVARATFIVGSNKMRDVFLFLFQCTHKKRDLIAISATVASNSIEYRMSTLSAWN